ncbi:MAG: DUF4349 domain-containing protein [Saccharofermentans sp.]|nr:DUF4349 domain-containing protein [Saccharofermentans sp.]
MKKASKRLVASILTLLIVLSLASCSSKDSTTCHNTYNGMSEDRVSEAYIADEGYSMTADAEYEAAGADIVSNAPQNPDNTLPAGNMLIRTVSISLTTENFDSVAELIKTSVQNQGGYFENMSISGTGTVNDYKTGVFVIRVPAENLDALTDSIKGNGTVISSNETTEDVTLNYIDIESHLSALRAEQDSLMALLEEAEDLDTIVQLENYLADVRYEIENYESQARTISNQVDYATLTLNLQEVVAEVAPVEIEEVREENLKTKMKKEFDSSVESMKEKGKRLLIRFAGSLPVITIRLVVLGIIAGFVTIIVKSTKKKKMRKALAVQAAAKTETHSDKKADADNNTSLQEKP